VIAYGKRDDGTEFEFYKSNKKLPEDKLYNLSHQAKIANDRMIFLRQAAYPDFHHNHKGDEVWGNKNETDPMAAIKFDRYYNEVYLPITERLQEEVARLKRIDKLRRGLPIDHVSSDSLSGGKGRRRRRRCSRQRRTRRNRRR
jgi:hypothetical protein